MKIGILGSDNSHALAFAKLLNLPNEASGVHNYPDVRVTHIFGEEAGRTAQVAQEGRIETIVPRPQDMLGQVDAAMVVFRHGSKHAPYALPFVEAGVPVFVDKPFTSCTSDARLLLDAAQRSGCLITGGSSVKYASDVAALRDAATRDVSLGRVIGGLISYPGDIHSEYDGIFFYAPHAVEVMLWVFGDDVKSVKTEIYKGELTAFARYEGFQVILNFVRTQSGHFGAVYGAGKAVLRGIDISSIHWKAFDIFYDMIRTGQMPQSPQSLLRPVQVIEALERSVREGMEVEVEAQGRSVSMP